MSIRYQTLVDAVFGALGAPATLVDMSERLLALSLQPDDLIDPIRRESVLHRPIPSAAKRYVLHHLRNIETFGWIPGDTALGILPRTVVALEMHGAPVGYLYMIDPEQRIQPACIAPFASEIRAVERELEFESCARGRSIIALEELLTGDRASRRSAALLFDQYRRPNRSGYRVVALEANPSADGSLQSQWMHAFRGEDTWGAIGDRHLAITRGDADRLLQRIDKAAGFESFFIGVGGRVESLEDAHRSYREALLALQVVQSSATENHVAHWDLLGAWRPFLMLDRAEALASIDARVADMIRNEDLQVLQMVLRYLERGSDTAAIAANFHLHRTTVYSRLRRLQSRYGLTWDEPEDRLMSIIGVRLGLLHQPQHDPHVDDSQRLAYMSGQQ